MPRRPQARHKRPLWHRSRLGWVNALGFALTLFLGLFLLLAAAANLLPKAEPVEFGLPMAFVIALGTTQVITVLLGAIVVFGFMWRGADFHAHRPRLFVFYWTCAGLLFFLVATVSLVRFGMADLPNAGRWAEEIYWGVGPLGVLCFALMAYVNIDIPSREDWDDPDRDGPDWDGPDRDGADRDGADWDGDDWDDHGWEEDDWEGDD